MILARHFYNLDFSTPYNGWIEWRANVLDPKSTAQLAQTSSKTWISPRATDANLVGISKYYNDGEKFLFYRGFGNFQLPLTAKFLNSNELELKNTSDAPISFCFVYQMMEDSSFSVWWTGGLSAVESNTV